jgi:hypothetical protein
LTDSAAHAGQYTNLQANAVNDYVTYRTPTSVTSGNYNVVVGFKMGSYAGKFKVYWANTQNGTYTQVGSEQNAYAANNGWANVPLGMVNFSSTGQKFFKFTVTGMGTGRYYQVFPDYVELIKP